MTPSENNRRQVILAVAALLTILAAVAPSLLAHEIPADVTVQAFVQPRGERLRLLFRVPLEAMRDFEFPLRGPGYLDLPLPESLLRDAAILWIGDAIEIYEDGRPLGAEELVATRLSLPSDRSFATFESALSHVRGPPLSPDIEIHWEQALLDALFEVPITSEMSEFSLQAELSRLGLRTTTVLRFLPADGPERAFQYVGDAGLVRLDPRWHQAAAPFVRLGFQHILDGIDHLLFLLCLVLPVRRLRPLIAVVTSFTVAHSITLIASAVGIAPRALWFPPLIETLIAASIVWMAIENIVGAGTERRWLFTFAFGLVHGFGFSFALRETLQFAGGHLLTSLLAFNVGVELGQLFVLALAVPAIRLASRYGVAERTGTILASAFIAHSGWHWMTERFTDLRLFRFEWPALDRLLLASAMRWTMLVLILTGVLWAMSHVFGKGAEPLARRQSGATAEK